MTTNEFLLLIHKSLTGQTNEDEKNNFKVWLNQNSSNQKAFQHLRLLWTNVPSFASPDQAQIQEQKHRLFQNLALARQKELKKFRETLLYRNAAILVLLLTAFVFILAYVVQQKSNDQITWHVNATQSIILADSSSISLNQNSSLSFNPSRKKRSVNFQGEGFFQIKNDPDKPFTVQLPNSIVKVLGTSFYVKSYPGDTSVVWVTTGQVEVQSGNESVILDPGDKCVQIPGNERLIKSVNNDLNFNAWYTNKMQFDKTRLRKIIKLLENQYQVTFKVSNSAILACRFTGTFENESLDTILVVLSSSMGFSFKLENGVYLINGNGCTNSN